MIDAAVNDLRPLIGEVAACSAVGGCRSGRRRRYPLKEEFLLAGTQDDVALVGVLHERPHDDERLGSRTCDSRSAV